MAKRLEKIQLSLNGRTRQRFSEFIEDHISRHLLDSSPKWFDIKDLNYGATISCNFCDSSLSITIQRKKENV